MAFPAPRRQVLVIQVSFLVVFALFLVYVWFFARWRPTSPAEIKADLEAMGVWAPLGAIVFQAIATVLLIPGFLLIIATALLFGYDAIWISLTGQTLGTVLCFLIARHVGRDPLRALLGQRIFALERALEERGFVYLLMLRTLSLLPTPFVVYAPGLVNLKLRQVTAAAILGQIPFVLAIAFFGTALGDVRGPKDLLQPEFLLPLTLFFLLISGPIISVALYQRYRHRKRIPRETMAEARETPPSPPVL